MSFFVKDVDEALAYDFAFAFRLGYSGEFAEEFLGSVNADHVQPKAFIVMKHVLELVFAEHAVIHEYTGEVLADSAVQENGGN